MSEETKIWLARTGVLILLAVGIAVLVGVIIMYLDLMHLARDWTDLHDGRVTD
ncbi:MAG: hypothetical protein ACRDK1_05930 [Solirubrobacterales bacterium]